MIEEPVQKVRGVLFLVFFGLRLHGATLSHDGKTVAFGPWSAPQEMVAKTDAEDVALIRRTCRVNVTGTDGVSSAFGIELVYSSAKRQVWMGEPPQAYAVVGAKIWGISLNHRGLQIRESESAEDSLDGEELIIEKFLQRFIQTPGTRLWSGDPSDHQDIDLWRVFGGHALIQDSTASDDNIKPLRMDAATDALTLEWKSDLGRDLLLTINSNWVILAASVDGQSIPVLFDNTMPVKDLPPWSVLSGANIASATGPLSALIAVRDYPPAQGEPEGGAAKQAKAVVVTATGRLWVGPAECKLAANGNGVLGYRVIRDSGELQVFSRPAAWIPVSREGSGVFWSELAQFDRAFAERDADFVPDVRIKLMEVLAKDGRFTKENVFSLRSVRVRDGKIVLTLNSGDPHAYLEIWLTAAESAIVAINVLNVSEVMSAEQQPNLW